jgi:succinate-acetate transporter protein
MQYLFCFFLPLFSVLPVARSASWYLVLILFSFLRLDSISYLLSMAEIRANHQILVVEDAMGLIVGSTAQRLNGMSFRLIYN